MSDYSERSDEEIANNERAAQRDDNQESDGIVGSIEQTIGSLTRPLGRNDGEGSVDEADRKANDDAARNTSPANEKLFQGD